MTDREKLVELIRETGMLEIEDCEYIADHLIANGVTVQRVTPITEDVPSGECLAVNDSGTYMVGKIVKDPYSTVTGYACMLNGAGIEVGIEDVTYWQPLPEPPKGVNRV